MNSNQYILLLLLLFFCVFMNVSAQDNIKIKQEGNGNTQINNINNNKKELDRLEKEVRQSNRKLDSIMLWTERIRQEIDITDSLYSRNIAQKDSSINILKKELYALIDESNIQKNSIFTKNQRIALLDSIIQIQKKGNFVPLGIKQIKNNSKALGYTFLVSEITVPIILGIGFEYVANRNYEQYEDQTAQTLSEHNNFYKKYENYHNAAIWAPIVSFVGIYGINILCNYYCTKIEIKPQPIFDLQGKCGIGISVGFKL